VCPRHGLRIRSIIFGNMERENVHDRRQRGE
jgi:hypothetical protein